MKYSFCDDREFIPRLSDEFLAGAAQGATPYSVILLTGANPARISTGYTPADSAILLSSPQAVMIYFPRGQRFPSFILGEHTPFGLDAKANPPIRTKKDSEALWETIRCGSGKTVGTDNAMSYRSERYSNWSGQKPCLLRLTKIVRKLRRRRQFASDGSTRSRAQVIECLPRHSGRLYGRLFFYVFLSFQTEEIVLQLS